jgi:hypothetical protein
MGKENKQDRAIFLYYECDYDCCCVFTAVIDWPFLFLGYPYYLVFK